MGLFSGRNGTVPLLVLFRFRYCSDNGTVYLDLLGFSRTFASVFDETALLKFGLIGEYGLAILPGDFTQVSGRGEHQPALKIGALGHRHERKLQAARLDVLLEGPGDCFAAHAGISPADAA